MAALRHAPAASLAAELWAEVQRHTAALGIVPGELQIDCDWTNWTAALGLARNARERAELWRIAGVRYDGIAAIREILKIDPRSNLIGLLLGRADHAALPAIYQNEAAEAARALADIDQVVKQLVATPDLDRPWLAYLAAAHLAARHGDLAATRLWASRAVAARPGNDDVQAQVLRRQGQARQPDVAGRSALAGDLRVVPPAQAAVRHPLLQGRVARVRHVPTLGSAVRSSAASSAHSTTA